MYQQIVDPDNTNRTVTDYATFLDADGRPLGNYAAPAVPYPVAVGATVSYGDCVYLVPPTTGAPGTGFPAAVAPLPASPTDAQLLAVVGFVRTAGSTVGAASVGAAVHPVPTVQVTGSNGSVVQVNIEAAVTVAVGDKMIYTGGTTAGKVNKIVIATALAATNVIGTVGGVFLTTKDANNRAFAILKAV